MKNTKQAVLDILVKASDALTTAEINQRYQRRVKNGTVPAASYDTVRGRTYDLVNEGVADEASNTRVSPTTGRPAKAYLAY